MGFLIGVLLSVPQWPDSVPVLQLDFDASQWEYACENYWQDIYVPAQLTCGGFSMECQFRIRGATSREYPKKSIKIELPGGAYLFGSEEFNLNAEYLDKTRFRELISYLFYAETGQTVPEVHLCEVVFNGESQGPYVSVQDVDGDFLLNTDLPDQAVIYKCADRYATLDRVNELGPYSKKTWENQPWDDLLLLMYWLACCPDDLFREGLLERFHYGDLLSCVATNVLIGHGSTYYHNYHLLLDETGASGKWRYITWDMDRTWGKYGPEFPYWRNSSNDGNRRNVLIWRMWCDPQVRSELIAEIEAQYPMLESFAGSGCIDSIAGLAAPLVERDPFRDYTMDQYWNTVEALKGWPSSRYEHLQVQFTQWPLPFRIYPPVDSEQGLSVSWSGAGAGCSWRIAVSPDSLFTDPADEVFRSFTADTFLTVPAEYTGSGLWLQVYGTRNGTEHRSSNGPVHPVAAPLTPHTGSVVITEINFHSSPVFDPGDWFEAVNAGDQPVSLAGWSIRDANPANLTVPGDIVLQPGQCAVFASDSFLFMNAFPGLPAPSVTLNFNLSDGGDGILLADPVGSTVDSLFYSTQTPWPDASGNGSTLILQDTALDNTNPLSWIAGPFGGTPFNTGDWDPHWPEHGAVSLRAAGPMPSAGNAVLLLTVIAKVMAEVMVYDLSGRAVTQPLELDLEAGEYSLTLQTGELPPGVYFVALRNMGFMEAVKITQTGGP